jgi:hypothetical protein
LKTVDPIYRFEAGVLSDAIRIEGVRPMRMGAGHVAGDVSLVQGRRAAGTLEAWAHLNDCFVE